MTKKNKKLLILSLVATCCLTIVGYSLYQILKPNIVYEQKSNSYNVSIEGAVKNPGFYSFKKPKKIREIIFTANVLTNADLNVLDLEKLISEDCEIVVPFKVDSIKKIKWKKLQNVEQLTKLGIRPSIAQIIINHRRKNETTTWEEILALKGIGEVTLAQLKDIIDLS